MDGGTGAELSARGVESKDTIWSANALLVALEEVYRIHRDYIEAGARMIIANTYGVIKANLALEGLEERFAELNQLACDLALKARDDSGEDVIIAGSLPPLAGSYRPDLVRDYDAILPLYYEQASILSQKVDILLCETMSTAKEAKAAAQGACSFGLPVWVSWTLHEDRSGRLRSGETIKDAFHALEGIPVSGVLANCCAPESITSAMPELASLPVNIVGGYANTFNPVPENWVLDTGTGMDENNMYRDDLDPEQYASHVSKWIDLGANVVGGCCGTSPAHIAKLKQLIETKSIS